MKKYFNRLKNVISKKTKKSASKHDIQGYKIIAGHINNPKSVAFCDPKLNEYIVHNKSTHYDLIVTPSKVLLVNTKDVIDLEVCEDIRVKVVKRIIDIISKDRQDRINVILGRKSNILDKILTNVIK
jgi:hypothetical protein